MANVRSSFFIPILPGMFQFRSVVGFGAESRPEDIYTTHPTTGSTVDRALPVFFGSTPGHSRLDIGEHHALTGCANKPCCRRNFNREGATRYKRALIPREPYAPRGLHFRSNGNK
jgi:hypothetical protein